MENILLLVLQVAAILMVLLMCAMTVYGIVVLYWREMRWSKLMREFDERERQ